MKTSSLLLIIVAGFLLTGCRSVELSERRAIKAAREYAVHSKVDLDEYELYSTCYFQDKIAIFFESKVPATGDHFTVEIDRRTHKMNLQWGH